jgi:RNA polymerase sigma-70 factor (ECF subfamily)
VPRARVHCLVPVELAERLEDPLRAAFADAGIEVDVDFRHAERRRAADRRRRAAARPGAEERRLVHARNGRRVGPRRATLAVLSTAPELPPAARPHATRLRFVERHPRPHRELEDIATRRLVIRLQAGEPGALDEIYERYIARVYGYLRVALRDEHEAEDVAHEVFVSLLRALPHFEVSGVPFRVWLFRVVRNHAMNHLRQNRRIEAMDPDEVTRRLDGHPPEALTGVDDAALLRLVECLPVVQRQVIVLRFVMGFGTAEVAEIVGRSPNAVSQLQRRALAILRERLIASGRVPETRSLPLPMRRRLREALVARTRRLALIS